MTRGNLRYPYEKYGHGGHAEPRVSLVASYIRLGRTHERLQGWEGLHQFLHSSGRAL